MADLSRGDELSQLFAERNKRNKRSNEVTKVATTPTLQSIHSDWSRNLPGPTLDLHAASKPLMKFLYHRAVLDFIKKHRGIPLSREVLEIHSSYLMFKYVSSSTKTAILRELGERAFASEDDARALVDSDILDGFISWWSDTNPPGPRTDLHAAYKPLMDLLYHKQALSFITKNHNILLSKEILEIYHSYLTYDICQIPWNSDELI
ncbi:hypothetical protein C8R44DRAFT_731238 [Mycena epipterygia]|nr:hypothetical protein C8R44DRAFT_731238 [Mycena epipterygia]